MKKIISLVLCIVLVLSFGMVSFADGLVEDALEKTGITIDSVNVADAYEVTVTYSSEAIDSESQVAILVYAGDKATEESIIYIDQFQHSTGTYTFPLYSTTEEGTYNVVMGATGVDVAGTTTFTIGSQEIIPDVYGDVSGDAKVTAIDASQISQNVVGTLDFTPAQVAAADVDANGTVTSMDASIVRCFVVKKIAELPYITEVVTATYDE